MTVIYNTDDSLDLGHSIFTQMNCVVDIVLDSVDLLMFSDAGYYHMIELQVQLVLINVEWVCALGLAAFKSVTSFARLTLSHF